MTIHNASYGGEIVGEWREGFAIRKKDGVWGRAAAFGCGGQMHPRTWRREELPSEQERQMWRQCLLEAVRCTRGVVAGQTGKKNSPAKRLQTIAEAWEWFASTTTDIGSFLWVCQEVLDLDPGLIRARIASDRRLVGSTALDGATSKRLARLYNRAECGE